MGKRTTPGANDALVPVGRNSEHLLCEIVDVLIQAGFEHVGTNQALRFDSPEEFIGLLLRLQQSSGAGAFYLSILPA
jgi:hypothetical protein